jgi:hypothetical protein
VHRFCLIVVLTVVLVSLAGCGGQSATADLPGVERSTFSFWTMLGSFFVGLTAGGVILIAWWVMEYPDTIFNLNLGWRATIIIFFVIALIVALDASFVSATMTTWHWSYILAFLVGSVLSLGILALILVACWEEIAAYADRVSQAALKRIIEKNQRKMEEIQPGWQIAYFLRYSIPEGKAREELRQLLSTRPSDAELRVFIRVMAEKELRQFLSTRHSDAELREFIATRCGPMPDIRHNAADAPGKIEPAAKQTPPTSLVCCPRCNAVLAMPDRSGSQTCPLCDWSRQMT